MSVQAIQGIPKTISLTEIGRSTGWTSSGNIATHEICNAGYIEAKDISFISGVTYIIYYDIISISGGYLNVSIGSSISANVTTPGIKSVSLVASGDLKLRVFSNANCVIQLMAVTNNVVNTNNKQRNTISFSQELNKWTSFYTFVPDTGCSLFTNLYTYNNGITYLHNPLDPNRGYIYGNQYYPYIKAVFNEAPSVQKMFQSINMNSGTLMITDAGGVTTSLGQISNLDAASFLQHTLSDGVTSINIYSKDGIYLARFLRDTSSDGGLSFGNLLKGNYITVDLYAQDPDNLKLMFVSVKSVPSIINVR
jgi:hypothetical protein